MIDTETREGEGLTPQPPDGEFIIKKIFVKDISFETPNSPDIFRADWKPDADVHIQTNASELSPGEYEVVLTLTITVKLGDAVAFLAEIHQSGIFGITGLSSEELGPTLGSYCPTILFPYARETCSDLVTRGGFPQFVLAPVNFEVMYSQWLADSVDRDTSSQPTS